MLERQCGSLFTRHTAPCAKLSRLCAVANRKRAAGRRGICQESLRKEVTVQAFFFLRVEYSAEGRNAFSLQQSKAKSQVTKQSLIQPELKAETSFGVGMLMMND